MPRSRVADPVVIRAVHGYQLTCGLLTIVAAAGVWLTRMAAVSGALWLIGLLLASTIAFVACRRPIAAAKREQNWYFGLETRIGADVGRQTTTARPVWPLHVLSIALAVAGAVILVLWFDVLPDPFPTHWNAAGQPDAWSTRTWWTVLATPLTALAIAAMIAGLASWTSRRHDPVLPDGARGPSRRSTRETSVAIQVGIGCLSVLSTAMLIFFALAPLLAVSQDAIAAAAWAAMAALVVTMLCLVGVTAQAQGRARRAAQSARIGRPEPDSPDDDSLWKLGLVYYNTNDPSVLVPKRSGIGYEPNAGHPLGMAIYLFALVAIVSALVAALTAG
ncbi:DUF1648 domain-containing protein [Brooklawnia cerclae]